MGKIRFLSYKLKENDEFYCDTLITEEIKISHPNEDVLGLYMIDLISHLLVPPDNPIYGEEMKIQLDAMKKGQWTFLFDGNGNFLDGNIDFLGDKHI